MSASPSADSKLVTVRMDRREVHRAVNSFRFPGVISMHTNIKTFRNGSQSCTYQEVWWRGLGIVELVKGVYVGRWTVESALKLYDLPGTPVRCRLLPNQRDAHKEHERNVLVTFADGHTRVYPRWTLQAFTLLCTPEIASQ